MILEKFLMIDKVSDISSDGCEIECQSHIPEQSPVFEEHFPHYPIMPGVLLIECMAQTSGYLAIHNAEYKKIAFLLAVDGARFREKVLPNTPIRIHSSRLHEGSGYSVYKSKVFGPDGQVASAEIRVVLQDFPSREVEIMMTARFQKLGMMNTEVMA